MTCLTLRTSTSACYPLLMTPFSITFNFSPVPPILNLCSSISTFFEYKSSLSPRFLNILLVSHVEGEICLYHIANASAFVGFEQE
jgi:hypothetical protein